MILRSGKMFSEFLEKNKRAAVIILMIAVGILLIIISGGEKPTEAEREATLEEELAEICSQVDGVGKCRVMISYKKSAGGEEVPYAVAVLCEGADSDRVRSEITELIGSLFGIGANRISVLKLDE